MQAVKIGPHTIRLNQSYPDREAAIRACGEILLAGGYIDPPYIDAMVERDRMSTIYVGNGVAVPHGTAASRVHIRHTGMALVQVPAGVDFGNGDTARLLVAIAAQGDEHMDLLTGLALLCADDESLRTLVEGDSVEEILALVQGGVA